MPSLHAALAAAALLLTAIADLNADPRILTVGFGGSGIGYNFPGSHGSASDTVTEIAVDRTGNLQLVGTTYSTDFPQIHGLQRSPSEQCTHNCNFRALFAARLSPDGQIVHYRTYISAPATFDWAGGPPPILPSALALDSAGNAYIGGTTTGENRPTLDGTVKSIPTAGARDAFLLKLDPNGRVLTSILIGGKDDDAFTSMVFGTDGFLYLAGTTRSPDFPITPGAYRAPFAGTTRVFVTKIKVPENSVAFTALLGEPGPLHSGPDLGFARPEDSARPILRVDSTGSAHVAVSTNSHTWPTTPGALLRQSVNQSGDIVIATLSPVGDRLLHCTYLGGSGPDVLGGLALDTTGDAYIAGRTISSDFPVTTNAFQQTHDFSNPQTASAFVAKMNADATRLEYSTYLGGTVWDEARDIVVDAAGIAYVGGRTTSADFPSREAIQVGLYNGLCAQFTPSGSTPTGMYYCGSSGFVTAVDPTGSDLVWSTHLGQGSVFRLSLDSARRLYIAGRFVDPTHVGASASIVRYEPGGPSLQFRRDSIVNAASFSPGLPHPGGLASIFVHGLDTTGTLIASHLPLPRELNGVSISVDGTPAPIMAVADLGAGTHQINFQVPFEATSNRLELRYKGLSTLAFPQTVAPGIFTLPTGQAAIQHADYNLVTASSPAAAGEVVIIYAPSLGPILFT